MGTEGKVAVIGAGLGGLSAALRLASRGLEVEVFERSGGPGGKAAEKRMGGYRFDMGPSLLTLPEVFKELFSDAGEDMGKLLRFKRLDPVTRYFFDDGTVLDAWAERERFASEVEDRLGEPADRVLRYLRRCERTFQAATPLFMFKPLHEVSTLASTETVRSFLGTPKLDAFRTMHSVNKRWFSDRRAIQLFDRYATYNGSSPYRAPGTFNLIQHVEYGIGGYSVVGGIHRIPEVIDSICRKKGVSFHYGEEVESIDVEGGKIRGIVVNGRSRRYDAVISNSDVSGTYSHLLSDGTSRNARKYSKLEPSSSGQVFLWGIKRESAELLTNNIFFSSDYKEEFSDIWERKSAPSDPTVYVNISSKIDPNDSPGGSENWFVLVNVPYNSGQDWNHERKKTEKRIISRLERVLGDGIERLMEVKDYLGPLQIESRYGGNRGSIYGISSNDRASAFLRQPNRSRAYRGLFFAGGSAHPGGGMPLVILSGKHAAGKTMEYLRDIG